MRLGFDHLFWFLRGGGVVEVDQGFLVAGCAQDGKVGADLLGIESDHGWNYTRRKEKIGRGRIHLAILDAGFDLNEFSQRASARIQQSGRLTFISYLLDASYVADVDDVHVVRQP